MEKDWNIIYESSESIDFDKILNIKKKIFTEKINQDYFTKITGLNGLKNYLNL